MFKTDHNKTNYFLLVGIFKNIFKWTHTIFFHYLTLLLLKVPIQTHNCIRTNCRSGSDEKINITSGHNIEKFQILKQLRLTYFWAVQTTIIIFNRVKVAHFAQWFNYYKMILSVFNFFLFHVCFFYWRRYWNLDFNTFIFISTLKISLN